MKRRDFFKKLGIGIGAVALAPKLLAEESPTYHVQTYEDYERRLRGYYVGCAPIDESNDIWDELYRRYGNITLESFDYLCEKL
jgi:hypothetical protein